MLTIEPATLHEVVDSRLDELAATLVGERLIGARYVTPSGASWVNDSDLGGVDDVDLGVAHRIGLHSRTVVGDARSRRRTVASAGTRWGTGFKQPYRRRRCQWPSGLVAHSRWFCRAVAVSFCVHSDGSSIRPWSCRVGLANGSSATVALGETDGNLIRYLPDNLVVIFEADTARGYEIVDGLQSAWGDIVPHGE